MLGRAPPVLVPCFGRRIDVVVGGGVRRPRRAVSALASMAEQLGVQGRAVERAAAGDRARVAGGVGTPRGVIPTRPLVLAAAGFMPSW